MLVLMAQPTAALGLILVEMDKAVKKISSIMTGEPPEDEPGVIGDSINGIRSKLRDIEV